MSSSLPSRAFSAHSASANICRARRIASASPDSSSSSATVRLGDPADQQHGLGGDRLDRARVLALPAVLVGHRRVDVRVVDAGGEVDEVDVALALEVADDPLDVLELEVARPERGRVDPVAHEGLVADRRADPCHRLDREPQPVLVRPAPAVGAVVVQRREELPRAGSRATCGTRRRRAPPRSPAAPPTRTSRGSPRSPCSSSSFGIGAFGYSPGGTWLGATMYQVASKS